MERGGCPSIKNMCPSKELGAPLLEKSWPDGHSVFKQQLTRLTSEAMTKLCIKLTPCEAVGISAAHFSALSLSSQSCPANLYGRLAKDCWSGVLSCEKRSRLQQQRWNRLASTIYHGITLSAVYTRQAHSIGVPQSSAKLVIYKPTILIRRFRAFPLNESLMSEWAPDITLRLQGIHQQPSSALSLSETQKCSRTEVSNCRPSTYGQESLSRRVCEKI